MITDRGKIPELHKETIKEVYSETVLDHGQNPRNLGISAKNNAFSIIFGPCGDSMAVWLYIENNIITDIGFSTDGCMTSLAAGSMVTELAKGKNIDDARQISQQDVLDALGGLPDENAHCALLAANTLKEAVDNYSASKKQS